MLACACREYNGNVGKLRRRCTGLRSRRHRRRLITLISLPGFSKESVYLSKRGLGSLIPPTTTTTPRASLLLINEYTEKRNWSQPGVRGRCHSSLTPFLSGASVS